MKNYPHLSTRLYNTPLCIHPEKAAIIESVFQAHLLGRPGIAAMEDGGETAEQRAERIHRERLAAYSGIALQRRDDKPWALTQSGIALIPVMGTLVQRAAGLDAMSGLQSYGEIGSLVAQAAADADVKGILLEIDSPGGEAAGLFDLADAIVAAGDAKPLWATANEQAFSAAYAVAASAAKLYLPRTGLAGSVGTIALHVDQSRRDALQGYSYTAVYAGAKKNDLGSHKPLSDSGLATLQMLVNSVNDVFVAHVAARRALDEQAVRGTEAGIFTADRAVDAGFADGIATLAETVAMLEAAIADTSASFSAGGGLAARRSSTSKEAIMPEPKNAAATTVSAEQHEAALAALRTEHAAALDGARAEAGATAVKAERDRIRGILGCEEAKGRMALAVALALDSDSAPEAAKKLLAAAPKDEGKPANALAAAMAGLKNPEVGADGSGDGDDAAAEARRIAAFAPRPATQPDKRAAN